MTNFVRLFHGGDLGDTVYAIAALRRLADPAHLTLYPNHGVTRVLMDENNANMLLPLLNVQNGVTADWKPNHHPDGLRLDFAVRRFYQGDLNLADMHSHWIGHDHWDREQPWLVADRPDCRYRIVVARSARYRNAHFPWGKLYEQFHGRAVFVGVPWEHENFEREIGRIDYLTTPSLLDVARLMAGADLFIGNQSCPRAVAESLKIPVIVEQAHPINTHFGRSCAWYPFGHDDPLPSLSDDAMAENWCLAAVHRASGRVAGPDSLSRAEALARACRLARPIDGGAAVATPDPTGVAAIVGWCLSRRVDVVGQEADRRFLRVYHMDYQDHLPDGAFAFAYVSRLGRDVLEHFRDRLVSGGVLVAGDRADLPGATNDAGLSVWRKP